ncbi:non-ribosomal peptide synthetase [Catenulispora sp. NL8]|uniref:Non-ribosomal peptide synthetase n=1 Tax=Catenulispora pinistramenti TaxID=2705254 RepID=A0ABS5KL48_9ACTN|nr:amino acid adenylation domain-containing protein [Catenulispora pinistramenti]MBS2546767.1 non-ribosomal peptide synthetase [Catenulispora pinistramenti]
MTVTRAATPVGLLPAHELFADRRRTSPGLPALEYRGTRTSYEDLGVAADRLTARLISRGVVAGSVVAIATERSPSFPIAVLAVLQADAAYLPLDPAVPAARLEFMMRDSAATHLIVPTADSIGLPALPVPSGIRVIAVDDDSPVESVSDLRRRDTAPDDLAYVMYTSGSTGVPKGVAMTHGPMANLIAWQRTASQCAERTRTLQFSAATFDASFQEMFSTWAAGGCLVLVDEEIRRDPRRLLTFIDDGGIHRLFLPFVALQALAGAACNLGRFPRSLVEVITAGEQLQITPQLRRLFSELPETSLENQYGPSETHIVTAVRLPGDPADWPELPSIGGPIDRARIYVLDESGTPLAPDEVGEIAIGGPVLARGYLNRPGLTAHKFVPDSSGAPGSRLYRTGDVGFIDGDGLVHFLGRADHQVKIRGHRVELGEVEVALKSVPGIADAVVVVDDGDAVSKRLVGYLIGDPAAPTAPMTPDEIRASLAATLPEYMLPAAYVMLDRFPMTPNGKVDRLELKRRPVAVQGSDRTEARDAVEDSVLALWTQSLEAEGFGVHDNYFLLGGNSLLALSLLTALEEAFDIKVDLSTLIQHPTVAGLSAWIREGMRA